LIKYYGHKERLIPKVIEYGKRGCYPHFVDKDISRDFVYIDDCIEALILAAVKVDSVKGWVINIASGVQTNMEEVAKYLIRYLTVPGI